MTHDQTVAALAATVAHDEHDTLRRELLNQIAGCFPRRETRTTCGQMLAGLMMELEDKNCWTLAEAVGHPTPDRLQHFLSRAAWSEQQVLDTAAIWALEHLDDGGATGTETVLVIDETADEKASTGTVGAAHQYSGTVGGVAMCQVAVTLTVATGRGHTLIDRALYLPASWAADEEQREMAQVPEEVMFATKPQLAATLLERAYARGIDAGFVAGDEVYGGVELRRRIRALGWGYVMAVRSSHRVGLHDGSTVPVTDAARLIPSDGWMRVRTGNATKGARDYHWAMLAITADDTRDDTRDETTDGTRDGTRDGIDSAGDDSRGPSGDGQAVLLIRRHRYTGTVSFYRCWSPWPVPLARLITVATIRWRIEEDHQLAKQTCGLDAGQVIRWKSWHRWTAMTLLAYIFLAVATAHQRHLDGTPPADLHLVPITIPELLRQLRGIVIPDPRRDQAHKLAWSVWRRRHQYRARIAHQRWHAYADATP